MPVINHMPGVFSRDFGFNTDEHCPEEFT